MQIRNKGKYGITKKEKARRITLLIFGNILIWITATSYYDVHANRTLHFTNAGATEVFDNRGGLSSADTDVDQFSVSAENAVEGGGAGEHPITPSTIEQKIRATWPEQPEVALAIARGESGLDPERVGDLHITFVHEGEKMGMSCGLMQIRILPGRPDCETMKNPDENLKFARQLYDKSGWYPWSVWKNGQYKKYL